MFSLEVIILLAVATLGLLVGRALRLPPIVAYLLAGIMVGPGGMGLVTSSRALEQLAELGVALLLFGVGIEFSLERLRHILPRMLATGGLQVAGTIAGTAFVLHWLGTDWSRAVFVGFLVSLSSTAIVFKLYDDDGEIEAPQGTAAAAILLFQDLALVPMMLLVPVLASPGEGALLAAGRALLAAGVAVGALLFLARTVLPRTLEALVRAHTPELFPLAALVIAFGTALGAQALGLSLPIGAFLAGLALSASRYAHQVFAELLPLRDAFVAIFFTSIGLLLQPTVAFGDPALLAGIVGAVAAKGILIGAIVGILWRSLRLAVLVGLALAQIGEFSFVLARDGIAAGIVSPRLEQAFLGAAVLTMAATPFLVRAARRLALIGAGGLGGAGAEELRDHVLVIGYGTTGQAVARVLSETGIPRVGVDLDPAIVDAARREKLPIHFGDASRRAVLEALGVARARAVLVAVSDPLATRRIVSLVRQSNATARILVRVRRVQEIAELERLGADDVIPSEFEVSIELFVRLLAHLGVPRHVARVQESIIRLGHYRALRGLGTTPELLAETKQLVMGGILENAQVMKGSAACGCTLATLDLRRTTGATVLSIVRNEEPLPSPDGATVLEAGDLVVLFGPHEAVDRALQLFEPEPGATEGSDADRDGQG